MRKHRALLSTIVSVLTVAGIAGVAPCFGTGDAGYQYTDGLRPVSEERHSCKPDSPEDRLDFVAQNIALSEVNLDFSGRGLDFMRTPFVDILTDPQLSGIETRDIAPVTRVNRVPVIDCEFASTQDAPCLEAEPLPAEGPAPVGQPPAMLVLGITLICIAGLGRKSFVTK